MVGCFQSIKSIITESGKPLRFLFLPLYNQRVHEDIKGVDLEGNWLFRRRGLDHIDRVLTGVKPEFVVFQELMKRQGVLGESDRALLSAGSLQWYTWRTREIQHYEQTTEVESVGVAFAAPLKLFGSRMGAEGLFLDSHGKNWSYSMAVDTSTGPVLIFNVRIDDPEKYFLYNLSIFFCCRLFKFNREIKLTLS